MTFLIALAKLFACALAVGVGVLVALWLETRKCQKFEGRSGIIEPDWSKSKLTHDGQLTWTRLK